MVCSVLISVNKLIKYRNSFLPFFRKAASASLYATSLNTETKVTKRFLPRYATMYVNHNGIFSLTTQSGYVEAKLFHSLITSTIAKQESVKKNARMCTTRAETREQISAENDFDTISALLSSSKLKLPSKQIKQVVFEDGEDIKKVQKLFSAPKNVLHNIFQILTEETNTSMHISPTYKIIKDSKDKSVWLCTYHIKWPTEVKFLGWHSTKKAAAHRAALAALSWLRNENKLTEKGMPIVYDKEHQRQLSKRSIPSMVLSNKVLENMNKIVALHQNEIMPHINMNKESVDDNNNTKEDVGLNSEAESLKSTVKKNQRYLDLGRYLAKEKIKLPIAAYKEQFLDMLRNNSIVIIQGEPGCGKSTRIPQYVLEGWAKEDGLLGYPGKIAVTQPRRIAAISLAERVSSERNEIVGHIVGYQVRLNSRFRNDTGRILYCTTGILLRHLQSDLSLSEFSHIILDEAHERDVNTDLLMNLIKQALELNPRLKLVIMSATINARMFSEYYGGAPILNIPGFTYPVKQYFLENYPIDISKTLKMTEGEPNVVHEDVVKVIEFIHKTKPEGAILCFLPGWEDIRKIEKTIPRKSDLVVYCLHSRLQDSDQWKIFSRPPPGVRKIILATNIAETSVTIDDVVYVVDTGMHKEQRFDIGKGLNCIDCHWISKSSVIQRKGRAGRVQAGECFHLYPKSKYESFPEYSLPEIVRTSLTKIVLDCKVFSNNMNALEFMGKLPTPPEEEATKRAVKELIGLELLDNEEKLTSLGRTLAEFQLEPKLSKAMVNAVIFGCVTPIIDIITLFSAETELFVMGLVNKEDVKRIKTKFCNSSDHLAMMKIFEKWLQLKTDFDSLALKRFCDEASLVPHKMELIEKLRRIHFDYIYDGLHDVMAISDEYSHNDELIKAVLFSGVGNVLQRRNWDIVKNRLKNNVNVFLTRYNHKASISNESVNHKRWKFPTSLLMYINETRSNIKRISSIRECSLIPEISVLLFSNNNLIIQEVKDETVNDSEVNDQVKLVLENTNVQIICDRMQASKIIKCKEALMAGYRYYIKNLTDLGEHNPELNNSWNKIVGLLNDILNEHGIRT